MKTPGAIEDNRKKLVTPRKQNTNNQFRKI